MTPLTGPVHAVALVLVAAGGSKLARPSAAGAALRTIGLPGSRAVVRALAVAEIAAGSAVVAGTGRPAAAIVAAFHLGFTGVALVLRRRAADCGCFGQATPVTGVHLAVNVAVAAVAAAAVVDPVPSLGAAIGDTPAGGAAYAVLVATLAFGEVLLLTALADVQAAAGRLRAAS